MKPTALQLTGWTPIRVVSVDGEPLVDWCLTEDVRFDDPFFDQTVERCFEEPFRLLFRHTTPLDTVEAAARDDPGVAPSGFVFHTSRCGSTLVAQMLSALPDVLVMSEPGPLDQVIRLPAPDEVRVERVRAMVGALGRAAGSSHRHYVVKLDAWTSIELPLLARAFPDTPWVFLFRDPAEVLRSQLAQRGFHMVPGMLEPEMFGLTLEQAIALEPEAYCVAVLRAVYQAGVHAAPGPCHLFVDYRQLPDAVRDVVAPAFGIRVDASGAAAMQAAATRNAKNPVLAFDPTHVVAPTPALRDTAMSLAPLYDELVGRTT